MTRWHREDDYSNHADDETSGASLDAYADADRYPDFDPTDVGNCTPVSLGDRDPRSWVAA